MQLSDILGSIINYFLVSRFTLKNIALVGLAAIFMDLYLFSIPSWSNYYEI